MLHPHVPSNFPMAYSTIYMWDFSVCVRGGAFLCGADLWAHVNGMTPTIKYFKFKNTMRTSSTCFKTYLSVRKGRSSISQRTSLQSLTALKLSVTTVCRFKILLFCQSNLFSWIWGSFWSNGICILYETWKMFLNYWHGYLKFDGFEWPALPPWKNHFLPRIWCNSSNQRSCNTEIFL